MNMIKIVLLALGFFLVAVASAEGLGDAKGKREAIMMGLYPPDIIMKHQQRLGISDAQRRSISAAVQKFQAEVADLQWTLQNDQQLLQQTLGEYPIQSKRTMVQVEKVLALESKFKLAHFRLLIAIKNELTADQVELIDRTIREKRAQKRQ